MASPRKTNHCVELPVPVQKDPAASEMYRKSQPSSAIVFIVFFINCAYGWPKIPMDSDGWICSHRFKACRQSSVWHGSVTLGFLVMVIIPCVQSTVLRLEEMMEKPLDMVGSAALLQWFANFEQTSLAEVAMSHIRVASVPWTSWNMLATQSIWGFPWGCPVWMVHNGKSKMDDN